MNRFPIIIAHRGASSIAPENTLPAFMKAIEMGCDAIELDVHLSKDGHVMVCHDSTLNRTTNGIGLINWYTIDELKKFDAGKHFSDQFANTQIPTLEEVFELMSNNGIKVIIELKGDYVNLERKVVELVQKFKYYDRAIISSFNHDYLRNIKKIDANIKTEVDLLLAFDDIVEYASKLKVNVVCPIHFFIEHMTRRQVRNLKKNNFQLYTFTVNNKETMLYLIKRKVDGIITDRPDLLIELKHEYNSQSYFCIIKSVLKPIKK